MKRALFLLCLLDGAGHADEPFRLQGALNPPAPIAFQGETRIRYETLDGQFRAGRQGSDQLLLLRTLLLAEADAGPVSFGMELQDSRTYLADAGTPLSTSLVNPLDVLQLYIRADDLPGLMGRGSLTQVTLGRQTVSIASRRQIERVDFANVIFSYTGAHLISRNPRGDALHLLYVVPTARFPSTRPALDDNELSGDEEQWGRHIWAAHAIRANLAADMAPGLSGEVFVYGLEERDTSRFQTPDRSYVTVGGRLYRAPQIGQWDIDVEAARRRGTRYATSNPSDTQSLSVEAWMLFAAAGFSFDAPLRPRLALEYYYASGDRDPVDFAFDQYERLFGSRRTDLNNTSIHGPLTPANISAPGLRLEVRPDARWDGWAQWHAVSLASSTDAWVIAGLRDPAGQSGRFVGHAFDARARYWLIPDSVRLEIGASALIFGEFAKSVPGGPDAGSTFFGYSQLTFSF